MPELILGAVALLVILLLLRGFAGANPRHLARALRYFGAAALLLAAIGLAFIDRVAWSIFAASCAWAVFSGGRLPSFHWPFGFPHSNPRTQPRGQTADATRVRTEWIEMTLDHDSGAMTGKILKGVRAGQNLDVLAEDEAIALFVEAGRDDAEAGRRSGAEPGRRFGGGR